MRRQLTLRDRQLVAATLRKAARKFEAYGGQRSDGPLEPSAAYKEKTKTERYQDRDQLYGWIGWELRQWADNVLGKPTTLNGGRPYT